MAPRRRKSNNPKGAPITVDASAAYLLKLPPKLLEAAREAAKVQSVSLAEWWRSAGRGALAKISKRSNRREG